MVLDGRPVTAGEGYRLGLVDWLVPSGESLATAIEWAIWLAGRTPGDLTMIKDLFVGARELELSEALKRETTLFVSRFGHDSVVERALAVQTRYDDGADSYQAFQLPPP